MDIENDKKISDLAQIFDLLARFDFENYKNDKINDKDNDKDILVDNA
jgi:hypothetical protein